MVCGLEIRLVTAETAIRRGVVPPDWPDELAAPPNEGVVSERFANAVLMKGPGRRARKGGKNWVGKMRTDSHEPRSCGFQNVEGTRAEPGITSYRP